MSLSLAQKENLYYELGQLLKTGISFGSALQRLSEDTRGSLKNFVKGLSEAAAKGDAVAEAFGRQPGVSDLEKSILAGSERSGRLEQGCRYLSSYFAAMVKARTVIVKGSAYPFLLLHLGIIVGPIRKIMPPAGSFQAYESAVIRGFFYFYACTFVAMVCIRVLLYAAGESATLDRILRTLPLFGKVRKAFSLGRFCATYEMQLQSGVNVMDSVKQAAKASQSAVLAKAVRSMLPRIRAGEQVGALMAKTGAFPTKMVRSIRLGEESGKLDEELKLLTDNFQNEAMARIATLSDWIPKILYMAIAAYVGYEVISFYSGMMSDVSKQME